MTRILTVPRSLALAVLAAVLGAAAGCGSSTPAGPVLTEQQRRQAVKRDADQVLKERQQAARPRAPR